MKKKTLVEKFLEDPERRRGFYRAQTFRRYVDLIESIMEKEKITRLDLVGMVGWRSLEVVDDFLDNGDEDIWWTIKDLSDVLLALGYELSFSATKTVW